jgi:hypothetical protein
MKEFSLRAYAVAAAVLALGLTGCGASPGHDKPKTNGEEKKPATEVFSDAHRAFLDAHSVHVRGHYRGSGVTFTLDEKLVPGGGTAVETSRYGVARFVTKDATYYLNVPSSYYTTGNVPIPPRLQGRWLERSADAHEARISLGDFFRRLDFDADQIQPQVTVNPGANPTITITNSKGSRLTVAGTGAPVPLAYTSKSGSSFTFDGYGAPVDVVVPANTTKISCGQNDCDPGLTEQ